MLPYLNLIGFSYFINLHFSIKLYYLAVTLDYMNYKPNIRIVLLHKFYYN